MYQTLNNVDHHDLHIRLGHGVAWGDAINLVPALPTEYEDLQREYPLLIRREGEGWQTFAMLGFEPGENLFLQGDEWKARYVPAARRLAPFKLARVEPQTGEMHADDLVVQIEVDHPRVSRKEGTPLFRASGGHAPYLEQMIGTLRAVHVGIEATQPMFAAFARHSLLEPAKLEITLHDGSRMDVPDVFSIGPRTLRRLSPDALGELHNAGFLRLAFMLSTSLANIPHLIDRKSSAVTLRCPSMA